MQFLFGVGEAGAFPNISKSLYNWFPASDRGFAKSVIWMSARLMGGLTPLLWVLLVESELLDWRQALWLFSAVAVVWCVVFYFTFRNKPTEHPGVNAAETRRHQRRPRGSRGAAVGAVGQTHTFAEPVGRLRHVCGDEFLLVFLDVQPPAGDEGGVSPSGTVFYGGKILLALLSGAPLFIGMFGCLLGGVLSDRFIRKTGKPEVGAGGAVGMIGYSGAGLAYLAAAGVKTLDPGNLWLFRRVPDPHGLHERPDHGPCVGRLPGHRPRLRGDGVRGDEHVRQPRRRGHGYSRDRSRVG